MEILATVKYEGFFVFLLIAFSLITIFFLAVSLFGVVDSIENGFEFNGVIALIVCIVITIAFGYGVYDIHRDGAQVEYKAKITDFNKVYNNGYKIIDQEGEIYTLERQ